MLCIPILYKACKIIEYIFSKRKMCLFYYYRSLKGGFDTNTLIDS